MCEYLAVTMCGVPVAVDPLIEQLVREMADVIIDVATRQARGSRSNPTLVEERAIELVASLTVADVWTALGTLGLNAERVACRLDELEVQLRAILRDELVRIASRARMPLMELDPAPAEVPARLRLVRP
jgi:LmbE family N-acetylglucosaminyl deacetylase